MDEELLKELQALAAKNTGTQTEPENDDDLLLSELDAFLSGGIKPSPVIENKAEEKPWGPFPYQEQSKPKVEDDDRGLQQFLTTASAKDKVDKGNWQDVTPDELEKLSQYQSSGQGDDDIKRLNDIREKSLKDGWRSISKEDADFYVDNYTPESQSLYKQVLDGDKLTQAEIVKYGVANKGKQGAELLTDFLLENPDTRLSYEDRMIMELIASVDDLEGFKANSDDKAKQHAAAQALQYLTGITITPKVGGAFGAYAQGASTVKNWSRKDPGNTDVKDDLIQSISAVDPTFGMKLTFAKDLDKARQEGTDPWEGRDLNQIADQFGQFDIEEFQKANPNFIKDIEDKQGDETSPVRVSQETIADLLPGKSPKERLDAYYNILFSEYENLSGELNLDQALQVKDNPDAIIQKPEDVSDVFGQFRRATFGNLTKKEQRMVQVMLELKALAPVVKGNVNPVDVAKKPTIGYRFPRKFMESFYGKEHMQVMAGQDSESMAATAITSLHRAGVINAVREDALKHLEKTATVEQNLGSWKAWNDLAATSSAIAATMATPSPGLNQIKSPLKVIDKLKGKKWLKFLLKESLEAGIEYQYNGFKNESLQDELNFGSGVAGGIGSGLVKQIASPLTNLMGNKLAEFVSRRVGAGAGEVAEENFQELYQNIRETDTFQEAWKRFTKEGPYKDFSEAAFFNIAAFTMGAFMGGGSNSFKGFSDEVSESATKGESITEALANFYDEALTKEEKAQVDQLTGDMSSEIKEMAENSPSSEVAEAAVKPVVEKQKVKVGETIELSPEVTETVEKKATPETPVETAEETVVSPDTEVTETKEEATEEVVEANKEVEDVVDGIEPVVESNKSGTLVTIPNENGDVIVEFNPDEQITSVKKSSEEGEVEFQINDKGKLVNPLTQDVVSDPFLTDAVKTAIDKLPSNQQQVEPVKVTSDPEPEPVPETVYDFQVQTLNDEGIQIDPKTSKVTLTEEQLKSDDVRSSLEDTLEIAEEQLIENPDGPEAPKLQKLVSSLTDTIGKIDQGENVLEATSQALTENDKIDFDPGASPTKMILHKDTIESNEDVDSAIAEMEEMQDRVLQEIDRQKEKGIRGQLTKLNKLSKAISKSIVRLQNQKAANNKESDTSTIIEETTESKSESVLADSRKRNIPDSEVKPILDAIDKGSVTPSSKKAFQKLINRKRKPASLVGAIEKYKQLSDETAKAKKKEKVTKYNQSKNAVSKELEKGRMWETFNNISQKLKNRSGFKKNSDANQLYRTARSAANSLFREIGIDVELEKFIELYEELLAGSFPNLYQDVLTQAERIQALDAVTEQSAKDAGFESEEAYAKAIAYSALLDHSRTKQGDFSGSTVNKLLHPAEVIFKEELAEAKQFNNEVKAAKEAEKTKEQSLQDRIAKEKAELLAELGEEIDPDDVIFEEDEIFLSQRSAQPRALRTNEPLTEAFFRSIQSFLKNAVPNVTMHYDQSTFDHIAATLGFDPATRKAIYYKENVYINPSTATMDTPIHEIGHVFVYVFRNSSPNAYKAMAKLAKKHPYWNEIKKQYTDAGEFISDEMLAMEVSAQMIGEVGLQRFKSKQDKLAMITVMNRLWNKIADIFGLYEITIGNKKVLRRRVDFNDASLYDFALMAADELFSNRQVALFNDLGKAEYSSILFRRHQIKYTKPGIETKKWEDKLGAFELRKLTAFEQLLKVFQNTGIAVDILQKELVKVGKKDLAEKTALVAHMDTMNGVTVAKMGEALKKLVGDMDSRFPRIREKTWEVSILGRAKAAGISMEALGKFMYAKHAIERNRRVYEKLREEGQKKLDRLVDPVKRAKVINEMFVADGSGMSDKEAQAILDDLRARGIYDTYENFSQEIREAFLEPMRAEMVDSGLISEEDLENIISSFVNYVPLRVTDYMQDQNYESSRVEAKGSGIQRIKGTNEYRYWNRQNPILGLVENFKQTLYRAEKNRILNRLADIAEAVPGPSLELITPKYLVQKNVGGDITAMADLFKGKREYIPFMRNGKLHYLRVNHKELLDAFDPPQRQVLAGLRRTLGLNNMHRYWMAYQNFRRRVYTTLNPAFAPVNFIRDYFTALALIDDLPNVTGKSAKRLKLRLTKEAFKVIGALFKDEFGFKNSPEYAGLLEEMSQNGADITFEHYADISEKVDKWEKRIKNLPIKDTAGGKLEKVTRDSFDAMAGTISAWNGVFERTMRVAAYKVAKEEGLDGRKAAAYSKNITVNFNKKGDITWFLNSFFLFSNAGIQGTYNMLARAAKSPRVLGNLGLTMLGNFLIRILNDQLLQDDDDKKKYQLISDGEKRSSLHIISPFGGKIKIFKLPLAYGVAPFKVLGDQLYDLMTGQRSAPEAAAEFVVSVDQTMNPFAVTTEQGAIGAFMPDIAKPVFEISTNTTFGGRPIYPNRPFGAQVPHSQLHFNSVSDGSKAFTGWMSEFTGGQDQGNYYLAGKSDQYVMGNPEVYDYLFRYFTGGIGTFGGNVLKTYGQLSSEDGVNWNNVPVVRRLVEETDKLEYRYSSMFYDAERKSATKTFSDQEMELIEFSYEKLKEGMPSDKRKRLSSRYRTIKKNQRDREQAQAKKKSGK